MEIDGNTHDKSCQLKLNNIDCHVNCHSGFDAQIGVPSIIVIVLHPNPQIIQ